MIADAPNINHLWAGLIVEELIRSGVDTFVVAPGSRSTPLAAAVANHKRAHSVVHFDERGAGYFALGYARAAGKPAAILCTSGTAVANLLPAVVEASNANVPLVLFTADRPPELLDTGANQTIDQNHLFGSFTRWSCLLPCPDRAMAAEFVLTSIDQGVHRAVRGPAGPVHINCAFREPLAPTSTGESWNDYLAGVARWLDGKHPYTYYDRPIARPQDQTEFDIISDMTRTEHGLLVVGQLASPDERDAVQKLTEALGMPVIADIASGLRCASVVRCADLVFLSQRLREELQPEVILWLGGAVTSKRTLQFIESLKRTHILRVADHPLRHDPVHRVTARIEADLPTFCRWLAASTNSNPVGKWLQRWLDAGSKAVSAVDTFFAGRSNLTEPGTVQAVFADAPADSFVFLGNSMPVRDADMVAGGQAVGPWVVANRGASGIDGNIATSAGIAFAARKPVTAVIGDLAALHDLNSLALVRDAQSPVILIILNNDGGGIFSFLPVADIGPAFERFFATPHGLRFDHAATMFGLPYAAPSTKAEFEASYRNALKEGRSSIIEVVTNRNDNKRLHDELCNAVRAALEAP